jgi:hypothetical protein
MKNLRGALSDYATPSKNLHNILQGNEGYNMAMVVVVTKTTNAYL